MMETCEKCGKPASGWTGLCYRCYREEWEETDGKRGREVEVKKQPEPPVKDEKQRELEAVR
ncbi:MAG: hypothetical protein ACXQS4_02080 [Methermicoccaceae archaeon]